MSPMPLPTTPVEAVPILDVLPGRTIEGIRQKKTAMTQDDKRAAGQSTEGELRQGPIRDLQEQQRAPVTRHEQRAEAEIVTGEKDRKMEEERGRADADVTQPLREPSPDMQMATDTFELNQSLSDFRDSDEDVQRRRRRGRRGSSQDRHNEGATSADGRKPKKLDLYKRTLRRGPTHGDENVDIEAVNDTLTMLEKEAREGKRRSLHRGEKEGRGREISEGSGDSSAAWTLTSMATFPLWAPVYVGVASVRWMNSKVSEGVVDPAKKSVRSRVRRSLFSPAVIGEAVIDWLKDLTPQRTRDISRIFSNVFANSVSLLLTEQSRQLMDVNLQVSDAFVSMISSEPAVRTLVAGGATAVKVAEALNTVEARQAIRQSSELLSNAVDVLASPEGKTFFSLVNELIFKATDLASSPEATITIAELVANISHALQVEAAQRQSRRDNEKRKTEGDVGETNLSASAESQTGSQHSVTSQRVSELESRILQSLDAETLVPELEEHEGEMDSAEDAGPEEPTRRRDNNVVVPDWNSEQTRTALRRRIAARRSPPKESEGQSSSARLYEERSVRPPRRTAVEAPPTEKSAAHGKRLHTYVGLGAMCIFLLWSFFALYGAAVFLRRLL